MDAFPRLIRVKQEFPAREVEDIPGSVAAEMSRAGLNLRPGARVAIAVGSRGIYRIKGIVRAVAAEIRKREAFPFIVPAMGSHGGATAEGQRGILESYGITEEFVGAPIISSMEVVEIGQTPEGVPVYFDKNAASADAIIPVNRVKPHTDFHGLTESGLLKIMAIGLGKRRGAETIHSYGVFGLREVIPSAARVILARMPVVLGLAILENTYERTARIVALQPGEMEAAERELLKEARSLMPSLPVSHLDVLVVQEIGKNISGVGMDPNITGRMLIRGEKEVDEPHIHRIVALDLTPESHGNALGMGLADVIPRRLLDKVDFEITYTNVITSTGLERGFIPITMENDREAIEVALKTCGRKVEPGNVKLVVIRNTLEITELYISESLLPEVRRRSGVSVLGPPEEMAFDAAGNLVTKV